MKDKVERIEFLADFRCKIFENDAMLLKFFDDGPLSVRRFPSADEIVERDELGFDLLLGELTIRLRY